MSKDEENRIIVQLIIKWPKGPFRALNAPIKKIIGALADLIYQFIIWLKNLLY